MLATLNRIARKLAATLAVVMIFVLAAGVYTMLQPLSSIMVSPWHDRVMGSAESYAAIHNSARSSDGHWPKPPATVKEAIMAVQTGVRFKGTQSHRGGERLFPRPIPENMVDEVADCLVLLDNGDLEVRESEAVRKAVRAEKIRRTWKSFWQGLVWN